MNIKTDLIPLNTLKRSGKLIDVGFVVAHDTGNPYSISQQNVNFFKNTANKSYASAHIFVDDSDIIMCIPAFENAEQAFHVVYNSSIDNEIFGDDANDIAIGVELCYFPKDRNRTLKAYNNYVNVIVDLMIFHNLPYDKLTSHEILQPENRTDPNNALFYIDKNFDDLKKDVEVEYMNRKTNVDLTWEEILQEALDSPEKMINAINAIVAMTKQQSDLGDIEQLKWLKEVFPKIYKLGVEQGKLLK